MSPTRNPTVTIAPGVEMPLVGFGTWQGFGDDALRALEAGYRHIDTATMYGNEDQVGRAVAGSGVPRDEVFITSKLPPDRADQARETLAQRSRRGCASSRLHRTARCAAHAVEGAVCRVRPDRPGVHTAWTPGRR